MTTFVHKTRIYMGQTDLTTLFENIERVCIVCDKFMVESGKVKYVSEQFEKKNIQVHIFDEVKPDPDIQIISRGVAHMISYKPDLIIAFGGGSAIDTAKIIDFFALREFKDHICNLLAIPTTAGTGSEVTCFSVVSDNVHKIKYPIVTEHVLPDAAVLDANLILSVPPHITADTGMDALTHAIESFVSTDANDFTDAPAEKALWLISQHLLTSYKEPNNLEARQGMLNASCLAGISFSNASLGITHSMAHALGAITHISHGRANALLLPYVIEYNSGINTTLSKVAERYAYIAKIMGVGGTNTRQSIINLLRLVREYLNKLNIPSLSEAIKDKKSEFLAHLDIACENAVKDSCTETNPVWPTKEDIRKLFLTALEN